MFSFAGISIFEEPCGAADICAVFITTIPSMTSFQRDSISKLSEVKAGQRQVIIEKGGPFIKIFDTA